MQANDIILEYPYLATPRSLHMPTGAGHLFGGAALSCPQDAGQPGEYSITTY